MSITGACQNAAFCPAVSRTGTWQMYSPGAILLRGKLNLSGTAFDLASSPDTTGSGGVSIVWRSLSNGGDADRDQQ